MAIELPEHYRILIDGETPVPSMIVAVLPQGSDMPTVARVVELMEQAELPLAFERVLPDPELEWARWEIEVSLGQNDSDTEREPTLFRLWAQDSEQFRDVHLDWQGLTSEESDGIRKAHWAIGCSCTFGDTPLAEFHLQLRVLAAIAPPPVAVIDLASCRPHSEVWLREVVSTSIPPNPTHLFTIHAVTDEERPERGVWLHTHGLLRCGTLELEVFNVPPENLETMTELLGATAKLFIESGTPEPGSEFVVGPNLDLVWLPWELAVHRVFGRGLGGRDDRDEAHATPSGVLFTPRRRHLFGLLPGSFGNPSRYAPSLVNNPILFISSMETERMRSLALTRLSSFAELLQRFQEKDDWTFLVKLGYQVDGAESEEECEHLWFEAHHITGESVDATLANEPYHISRMHEGDRATHPIDLLTDWTILSPLGRFDPDSVMRLEQLLEQGNDFEEMGTA